ncbi:hypothetical protein P5673_027229 [Acropora cervicornis]|uniref:F-box domain-containing protein n=1 Tax=Acropora cervicornis TaxID=6130 RepID=A0AAD9UW23_ACRCE|nr:hypothetical protein P5673_027229 [Acropora cervicornis]
MAAFSQTYLSKDLLSSLSAEVLDMILSYLPAKSLLNVSECNRRLLDLCRNCNFLWKHLCKIDFNADLTVKGSFPSFFLLYQLLYKSRIILEDTDHSTYSGYIPDWLYYWSALSTKPPLPGFSNLPAGRTKKTWGLKEEDLTNYQMQGNNSREGVRLERYYSWTDGLEAALWKHKSRQKFHEVALKRCVRSQKQIHKAFPKASKNQRKRAFNKFQNEHRKLKNILSKQKEGASEILINQCPQKIGEDYIDGYLHKSGIKQLESYIEFAKQLEREVGIEELIKDIPECVLLVYEKMSPIARQRFIPAEEFLDVARVYLERVKQVWRWQNENGTEGRQAFRDCDVVKAFPPYSAYIQTGCESHFRTLRLNFEGLEILRTWLDENAWITQVLDSDLIDVVRGAPSNRTVNNEPRAQPVQALKKMVKVFLKSGRKVDFDKILKRLAESARIFLHSNLMLVDSLERSLVAPL